MSEIIVIVTGGFDPIHSGHIAYFEDAKKLGDKLVVGLNSDEWLINKKGRPFMPLSERIEIVKNLRVVDKVITFNDQDNSASDAIKKVLDDYPNNKIIFANGGDRTLDNILEMDVFKNEPNVFPLLNKLDEVLLAHGGRLYLAKDSRMSEDVFKAAYPNWERFVEIKKTLDPSNTFVSRQSMRLGLTQ